MEKREGRLYGLDILRILSMILITIIHFIAYSLIMFDENITTTNHIIMSLFYSVTVVAVNVFVLITGYFQCDRKVNYKRLFTLWFDVIIVSLLLFVIMVIVKGGQFNIMQLVKTIFPVLTGHWWFLSAYIVLCIACPLLNALINVLNQKTHLAVCVGGFLIFCVFYVSNPFITSTTYIASSRGVLWFFYLYIVAAYFKKYQFEVKRVWLLITGLVSYGLIVVLIYFNVLQIYQAELTASNSPLAFVLTVCVFLLFKSMTIKNTVSQKIVSLLSESAFFVYIIQEHEMVRYWYWERFDIPSHVSNWYLPLILLASVLLLWPIAILFSRALKLIDPLKDVLYNKLLKLSNSVISRFRNNRY